MVFTDFDHQKKILITRFEGDVELIEIIDYINATRDNKSYPRGLRILTDSRKSNMLITPDEIPAIVEANNRSLKNYTFIIDAIILENPHDTAMSYLFQELSKTRNYFFEIFASYEAANEWLLSMQPKL